MRHWMNIRWTTKKPYSLNLNKPINVHIKMEQPTQHQKIARKICNIIEASKTMATDCSTTFFYMFYIEFYFWLWDMYFWFYLFFPLWNAIIKWSMQINKCPTNWYEIGCQTWFQTKHNWVTVYFGIAFFFVRACQKCWNVEKAVSFHYSNLICTKSSMKLFLFC